MEQMKIKGGNQKIYMSPSTSATVVGSIPDGAIVDVEERINVLWCRVAHKGRTGYIYSAYLEPLRAPRKKPVVSIVLPQDTAKTVFIALKEALKNKPQ